VAAATPPHQTPTTAADWAPNSGRQSNKMTPAFGEILDASRPPHPKKQDLVQLEYVKWACPQAAAYVLPT